MDRPANRELPSKDSPDLGSSELARKNNSERLIRPDATPAGSGIELDNPGRALARYILDLDDHLTPQEYPPKSMLAALQAVTNMGILEQQPPIEIVNQRYLEILQLQRRMEETVQNPSGVRNESSPPAKASTTTPPSDQDSLSTTTISSPCRDPKTAQIFLTTIDKVDDPPEVVRNKKMVILTAKSLCQTCLRREMCLNLAIENAEPAGIWGGQTPEERQRTARRRSQKNKSVNRKRT